MHKASSLGELLTANHIENSLFDVLYKENASCSYCDSGMTCRHCHR